MNVGVKVREISTGQIGVVEKGNNANGYYVNFGSRKNWKKTNEIELIVNTIGSANNSAPAPPIRQQPSHAPTTQTLPVSSLKQQIQASQQQQQQQQQQPPKPKVQSEDPGPRFGNFKLPAQNNNNNPKYSTLPSRAFFEASSASSGVDSTTPSTPANSTFKPKPLMNGTHNLSPSRPGIPSFDPPPTQQSSIENNNISQKSPRPVVSQPPTLQTIQKPSIQPPVANSQPPPIVKRQPIQPPTQQQGPPPLQTIQKQPQQSVQKLNIPPQQAPTTQNNNKIPSPTPSPRESVLNDVSYNIDFKELKFENEIGAGKYGVVYVGRWLGTPVAIKKLLENNDETNGLVERELQILKEIRHPQIVQFLGVSRNSENEIHIITEFMDGGDLFDALIFGDVQLTWKEKLRISLDLAQSCRYLQARGILHRDLKSQNVLLSTNKRAKLCDLGLARVFDDRINKRLTVVGSDRWMAPEISMGEDYDYRIDVFSYGIVLVEIITGQIPDERFPQKRFAFDATTFMKKVPQDCPPAFSKLTVDCTKTNPKERPSFVKILEIVEEIYDSLPDEEYVDDQ